jgi:hypothetical protein
VSEKGEGNGRSEEEKAEREAPGGALGASVRRETEESGERVADGAGGEQDGRDLCEGKPEAGHEAGDISAPFQTGAMTVQPAGRSGP